MNGYKIAVIGDRESIMGFRALGLDVYPAEPNTIRDIFRQVSKATDPAYAIIYITEELTALIPNEIAAWKDTLVPAIIPIPSRNGTLGLGMDALNSAVERAVGSNIL